MKLNVLGKLGEFCNEASVPIIPGKEKVIGFRQLEYTIYRRGVVKKVVLPTRTGWVYLTDRRILMLDDGWTSQEGVQYKRYQEVVFEEADWVRHKIADSVWIDFHADDGLFTIRYTPYGAATRLFDWLLKEKDKRQKIRTGELESAYAKEKWYRHPPK